MLTHGLTLIRFSMVDMANRRILGTLYFSVFATVIGVGIVVPLLPVHAHELGAGGLQIAMIFGAYAVSRAVFLPVFGHLSDRKGRKTFLTVGLFAYALVSLALAYLDSIAALVVIRLLHGIASAMLIPIFQAYAADLAPAGREGRVMGLYGTVVLLGMSLGPFAGGLIHDHWGLRATFWIMGVLALMGFVACAWLLPPAAAEREQRNSAAPRGWRYLLRDRKLTSLFVFRFAYVVCVGIIWAFVPLYAAFKLSLSSASIGLIITLGIASAGLLNAPMGILADRVNRTLLVVAGGVIAAAGILAFQTADSRGAFVLASILFGAGGGICMPALMALAAEQGNRSDAMASVMALMTVAHSFGMLAGALVGGFLMDHFALSWAFPAGAIVIVMGTLCFLATALGRRVTPRILGHESPVRAALPRMLTSSSALAGVRRAPPALIALILVTAPTAAQSRDTARPVVFRTQTMGTWASLTLVTADSAAVADLAYRSLLVLHRVDSLMSNWTATSEVARINREAGTADVVAHSEIATVLELAERVTRESDGAMDITVEPVVRLWGFLGGPRRVPTQAEISNALASVGPDKLRFDSAQKTIRFTNPNTKIDLGGIAKGYGVDRVAELLRHAAITDALIDLSGNMVALGDAAGKDGWHVGIRDPSGERPYLGTVHLRNGAISTSGNYEQFIDADGRRYGHIIDPRTGWPADGPVSVTVVANSAMLCDAWDTGLFVLGAEKARAVAQAHDEFAVVIIEPRAGGGFVVWVEEALRSRFKIEPETVSRITLRYF